MNELYNKNGILLKNVWKNIDNHIIYAKWLGEKLEYTKPEDWYKISKKNIENNKGGGLLSSNYNNSPIKFVKILIKTIYPEYEWLEWKFVITLKNFWKDTNNHKLYADWLGKELGYTKLEHWYDIKQNVIVDNYGDGLIRYYNSSPIQFLRGIYPDYKWLEWKFEHTSNGFWKKKENHKIYFEWLCKELGYINQEDWYNINQNTFNNNYGRGMLKYYKASPIQFLRGVYPNYKWLEWNFGVVSNGFWQDINNHKLYADWLGKKLGYTELEHWYDITVNIINDNDGGGLIQYYNGSTIQFLRGIYPDYKWLEWKFGMVSKDFWQDIKNHKLYADWLGKKLGYTELKHWYYITQNIINDNDGCGLISNYYNSSPKQFLRGIYPDYEWIDWKFKHTTNGFWQDTNNHKIYAHWLGKELGYTELEHWYDITYDIISDNDGDGLLTNYYNGSPKQFLKTVYPDYKWIDWKFKHTTNCFWQDINNHKIYADWLGKKLGYTELEDWYEITYDIIIDNDGGGLLVGYYNGSPIQFLRGIYPDYEWIVWKLSMVSNGFWQDTNNHKLYTDWLGKKLGYTEPEHWYNITQNIINNNDGGGLLQSYYNGSPSDFIMSVYPEYEWDKTKFYIYKTEAKLYNLLITIYPTSIRQFTPDWVKPKRFDFCIPENKIIIELDGRQHFQQVSNWSSPEEQFENDKYKEKCANDNGYSVIRLLQKDVFDDTYDWFKKLCDVIEEIKNEDEIVNIYLCNNEEYHQF